ncbi:MAG TPA: hypothetical protein VLW65_24720 [Bryobacteraceae bacterium]|nr:hypothetical protein [Bryobacteraceae bacterium]
MSCPYFEPVEPHPRTNGTPHSMLPLGGAWTGTCHAHPAETVRPDDSLLQRLCNLGYARGVCPRFPAADPGPDAARFTLVRDDGASLRIYYVLERDHQPFAHGPLEFIVGQRAFTSAPAGELTACQAAAYAASYLLCKTTASK